MTDNKDLSMLKPNSHSYHAAQKKAASKDIPEKPEKLDAVVTGQAKTRKQSTMKKVENAILADDANTVKSYLIWDVLIPAIKDTLSDLVKKGIDALLFGEGGKPNRITRDGASSYVSYSDYYKRPSIYARDRDTRRPDSRYRRKTPVSFDDIVFERREDAEKVLENLVELTMMYGMASVADFYELSNMDTTYIDNQYGWFELSMASVRRVRDGYILDMPKAEKLDME